jgi:hypothetical protein
MKATWYKIIEQNEIGNKKYFADFRFQMGTLWTADKNKGVSKVANPFIFLNVPNGI